MNLLDMWELLSDNVGLRMLKSLTLSLEQPHFLQPWAQNLHEIPSFLTWVYYFTLYIAVLAESHPGLVQQRLAYMALIIQEGQCNWEAGWRSYDAIFFNREPKTFTKFPVSLPGSTILRYT